MVRGLVHAFVSVIGVVAIAGYAWQSLSERAPAWVAASTGIGVIGASLVVIVSYFTTAHGDRPRWREATARLSPAVVAATTDVDVFSQVPGVIAHYLGVPPDQTMGHRLVHRTNGNLASAPVARETWFVLESAPGASRTTPLAAGELRAARHVSGVDADTGSHRRGVSLPPPVIWQQTRREGGYQIRFTP